MASLDAMLDEPATVVVEDAPRSAEDTIAACEAALQAVLREHGCTLVYEETRRNGAVTHWQISVVKA